MYELGFRFTLIFGFLIIAFSAFSTIENVQDTVARAETNPTQFNEIITSHLFPETYFSEEIILGFGVFFGFTLILIIYGLLIYVNVKQPVFLWFAVYVFFISSYIFVLSGLVIDLTSSLFSDIGILVGIGLFLGLVKFFQLLTCTTQFKKRHQWLNRFKYMIIILGVMYFILPYPDISILLMRIIFIITTVLIFIGLKNNPELTKTQSSLMAGSLVFLLLAMFVLAVSQWSDWFLKTNLLRWGIVLAALHIAWITVSILYRIKKIGDSQESLWLDIRQNKKELLSRYLEGVEGEKKRIVSELKDSVLTDIKLLQGELKKGAFLDEHDQEELSLIQNRLVNITSELEAKNNVKSKFLEKITALAKGHQSDQTAFKVNFFNFEGNIDSRIEQQLHHIIQEAIQNIEKHAKATEVEIQLIQNEQDLILTIEDNGVGFNLKNNNTGIGINNMTHRAEIIKASLNIRSTPEKGTSIYVAVRLN